MDWIGRHLLHPFHVLLGRLEKALQILPGNLGNNLTSTSAALASYEVEAIIRGDELDPATKGDNRRNGTQGGGIDDAERLRSRPIGQWNV
jgi:hypothetical protein